LTVSSILDSYQTLSPSILQEEGRAFVNPFPDTLPPLVFEVSQDLPDSWALNALFRILPLDIILDVLGLVLLEKPIAVLGQDFSLVSAIASSLMPLIAPFTFSGGFIPILPVSCIDILEAPTPFVVGLTFMPEVDCYGDVAFLHTGISSAISSAGDPSDSEHYEKLRSFKLPEFKSKKRLSKESLENAPSSTHQNLQSLSTHKLPVRYVVCSCLSLLWK
jgi:hypothetical protein